MQHTLLVKVRHTLRYLVYHFQCVDSCGISVAQALQVFDKVSLWIILTDLFKRSRRQPNNKFSGKRDLSHQKPRWVAARAGRAKKLQHVRMVEGLPYPDFAQKDLARCRLGEHFDRDRVVAPRPAVHVAEIPNADLRLKIDLESRDRPAREAKVYTLRQPPQRMDPRLDEFAVERVRAAVPRGGLTGDDKRAVSSTCFLVRGL